MIERKNVPAYALLYFFHLFLIRQQVQAQLSISSLPDVMFGGMNPTKSIVEGSVVWLYCEVNSTSSSLSVTWNKDEGAVVANVPHIILRTSTSSSSTTLLLVLDNVVSSDAGQYQCTAVDGQDTVSGTTLTVTTVQASMTGVLEITSSSTTPSFILNRAAVTSGYTIIFPYTAGYVGGSSGLSAPSAMWLKDGVPPRITSTDVPNDGQLSSTLSFTFQTSDAGVYICIFTSGTNSSQIYGTNPLRLDTGSFTVPKRVSPPVIFLTPPEKLVLEYSTSGGYGSIILSRNQQAFGTSLFPVDPYEELTFFAEIFVRSPTTSADLGIYDLVYTGTGSEGTIIVVTSPASPSTSLSNGQNMMETIMEGANLEISCTSTGGPVPTITWTIDNRPTTFNQSDTVTNTTNNMNTIIPGNVVSKLQIVNAQYPTHDGEYTCIGSNSFNGMNNSNSTTITVVVQAVPEVQLTADHSRVSPGSRVILSCVASMGNPVTNTFTWTFNGSPLFGFSSSSASSEYIIDPVTESKVGNYSCTADNGVGSDVATISISLGVFPMVITQVVSPGVSVVVSGSTVQITCVATAGDLPITLTWSDPNGGTVMATSSNSTASTISITSTMSSDYGNYTCNGSNAFGYGSDGIAITQAVAPMVSTQLGSPEVQAGANLTLIVDITAFNLPLTSIIWIYNGNAITDGQNRIIITNPSPSDSAPVVASLLHTSVIPLDTGNYTVTAINPAGNNTFTFNVFITDPASITDPSNDESLEADFGSVIVLNCTARGIPAPTISWQPTPKVTPTSSTIKDGQGFSITISSVTIFSAQRTDTMFSCTASNTGQSQIRVLNITINFAPENPIDPVSTAQILSPESLSLNCTFEGFPVPSISWIRSRDGLDTVFDMTTTVEGGRMLTISSSSTTNAVTSILSISPARVTDTASYSCNATNRLGFLTSAVSMVNVYESPTIVSPMNGQQFTVNEGSDMDFTCMATGSPSPSIFFLYEGQILNCTDGRPAPSGGNLVDRVMLSSESSALNTSTGLYVVTRTLTLFNAVDGDGGNFMCSAFANIPGTGQISDTTSFSLLVYLAPSVGLAAGQIAAPELEAGNNLTLSVNITRFTLPLTSITWNHAGNILTSGTDRVTITNSPSVLTSPPIISTLQSTSLIPNDFGMYVVTATNEVGSTNFTFDVEVPGSAVITNPSADVTEEADEGNTVVLSCTARGLPRPNITWSPGPDSSRSVTALGSTDAEGFKVVTSNITITNIQRSDTLYICNAFNAVGSQMRSFTIIVNFPPGILTSPVNMQVLSPNQLSINCSADGLPLASVVWIRTLSNNISTTFNTSGMLEDGRDFVITSTPSTNTVVSVFSVTSTLATDTANYTCRASNRLGTADSDTSLVSVYVAPNISIPMESQQFTVNEKADIIFTCTAYGSPAPSISFLYEGQELTRTDGRSASLGGPLSDRVMLGTEVVSANTASSLYEVTRTLTLFNATDQDSVNFICSALVDIPVRGTRYDNVTFSLLVYFFPAIMLGSGQVASPNVSAGNNFNLVVSIGRFNSPLNNVMWMHNNSILMNMADRVTITNPSSLDSAPVIATLQRTLLIPLDAGDYVVTSTNMVGSATLTFTVTVTAISELTDPSNDVSVERDQGDPLTLSCAARGYPRPTINWSHTGMITTSTSTDSEGYLTITSNLTIASVMREDSGVYICTANNTEGMDAHSFNLTVYLAANITEYTSSQVVTSPNMATFTCTAEGLPRPNITWTDPDGRTLISGMNNINIKTVNSGERFLMSTLQVMGTSAAVSGTYSCSADNYVVGRGDVTSVNATLTVYVVPNITSYLPEGSSRYVVNATFDITFQCTATGVPPPDIQWFRGSKMLNLSSPRVTVGNAAVKTPNRDLATVTREITISSINIIDADTDYRCEATNDAMGGVDMEVFELYVQVPPTVVPLSQNQREVGVSSENVTLSFTIMNAVPEVETADIRWYYAANAAGNIENINLEEFEDITELMKRTTVSLLMFSPDRLNLTISNIVQAIGNVTETDQGRYFLSATNSAGERFNYIDVVVRGPPQIVAGPVAQFEISNGSDAVFQCGALAIPQHNVTWFFTDANGVKIEVISTADGNFTKYLVLADVVDDRFGQLTVANVTYEDRGTYMCVAANEFGIDSAEADLTVQAMPTLVGNGITSPRDTLLNAPVAIFCQVNGFPVPSISWQKDGMEIINSDARVMVFTFQPVLINNNGASDFESSAFNGNITEIIIENALMVSSFNTMDNLSVVGVLYFNNVVRDDTSNYHCIASNELPQTTLITTPSPLVTLTVLEHPDPPVNVILLNPGPRSVNIQWMPTFNGNRKVQHFIVYQRNVNTSSDFVEVANLSVSALAFPMNFYTANITNIDLILPFTVYSVVVEACNEIGCSSQSNESNQLQTSQDLSTPPRSFTVISADTSNITMEWIIPDPTHGIISQYRLSFRGSKSYNSGFSDEGVSVFNSSNAMVTNDTWRAVLQGLIAGTEYQVTVAAVNGAARNNGIGMSSAERTVTTLSLPPPPPPDPVTLDDPVPLTPTPPWTYPISVLPFSEINGLISHYHVIVVIIPTGRSVDDLQPPNEYRTLSDFSEYSPGFCIQEQRVSKAYIAAEYGRNLIPPKMYYIVGNNDSSNPNSPNDNNQYMNGPLCYGTSYTFFFRAYIAMDISSLPRRSVRQANNRQYTMFTSSSYYPAVTTGIPTTVETFGSQEITNPPSLIPVLTLAQVGLLMGGTVGGFILLIIIIVIVFAVIYVITKRNSKRRGTHYVDTVLSRTTQKEDPEYECIDLVAYKSGPKETENIHRNPSYGVVSGSSTSQIERFSADSNTNYETIN